MFFYVTETIFKYENFLFFKGGTQEKAQLVREELLIEWGPPKNILRRQGTASKGAEEGGGRGFKGGGFQAPLF